MRASFVVHESSAAWLGSAAESHLAPWSSWWQWLVGGASAASVSPLTTPLPLELPLAIPLAPKEAIGLEHRLRALLQLPPHLTVFAIVRADEAKTAPPLPLVLLHGLVDASESDVVFSVRVRPFAQVQPGVAALPAQGGPPPLPLPLDALVAGDVGAGAELLRRLRCDGIARLVVGPELAATLLACYEALPAFFAQSKHEKAQPRPEPHRKSMRRRGQDPSPIPTPMRRRGCGASCGREKPTARVGSTQAWGATPGASGCSCAVAGGRRASRRTRRPSYRRARPRCGVKWS